MVLHVDRWDKEGIVNLFFHMEYIMKLQITIFEFWSVDFLLHWFSSTDTALRLVGLMFEKQQNESLYDKSVSVTETVFRKRTLILELFLKLL